MISSIHILSRGLSVLELFVILVDLYAVVTLISEIVSAIKARSVKKNLGKMLSMLVATCLALIMTVVAFVI